jgi:mazG nucleotide pyrophosphohydrolase domain
MTINDYQKAALRTANLLKFSEKGLLTNGVLGLSGESGECADIVKKHLFQGHELDAEKLANELGDVAWYLALASYAIGYSLEAILQMNVDKLLKRYPDGFSAERSIHREEEQ